MATRGQTIENPVTGERARWLVTAEESGGRFVRAEWWTRPGGGVGGEHVHAVSTETFEVLSGRIAGTVGGEPFEAGPGERLALPPGVPHVWRNASDTEELHFVLEVAPPGRFEDTVELIFGLGREGRLGKDGMPGLLQMAVTLRAFGLDAYPSGMPRRAVEAAAALLAPVGRLRGLRPTYARFAS